MLLKYKMNKEVCFMLSYIFKRLISILIALFFIISATFFLMKLAPGSPFASERQLPATIEQQLNAKYGLDNPWYIQYKDYLVSSFIFESGALDERHLPWFTLAGIVSCLYAEGSDIQFLVHLFCYFSLSQS